LLHPRLATLQPDGNQFVANAMVCLANLNMDAPSWSMMAKNSFAISSCEFHISRPIDDRPSPDSSGKLVDGMFLGGENPTKLDELRRMAFEPYA
jgi:hypothetical protein